MFLIQTCIRNSAWAGSTALQMRGPVANHSLKLYPDHIEQLESDDHRACRNGGYIYHPKMYWTSAPLMESAQFTFGALGSMMMGNWNPPRRLNSAGQRDHLNVQVDRFTHRLCSPSATIRASRDVRRPRRGAR